MTPPHGRAVVSTWVIFCALNMSVVSVYVLELAGRSDVLSSVFAVPLFHIFFFGCAGMFAVMFVARSAADHFERGMTALLALWAFVVGAVSEYYAALGPTALGLTMVGAALPIHVASLILAAVEIQRKHKRGGG
jgi:hypothetical protein